MNLTTNYPINAIWSSLSRAYEIALLGNHSINIVYSPDYIQAADDFKIIKQFYSDITFQVDADIIFEICKPQSYNLPRYRYETLEDIHKRVEAANSNPMPDTIENIDTYNALLSTSAKRLDFSIKDIEIIESLSRTIAKLDNSPVICAHHLAEAIHYRCIIGDCNYISAIDDMIHFGPSITIKRHQIDPDAVQAAIEYLQKCL